MIRVLPGDCRAVLPSLAAGSVHMVCTSPPYYGLRDYGVAGQIGLEATPDEYLQTMVAVFREVRRVLRDDGTCWVNMGDSYATQPAGNLQPSDAKRGPASYRRSNIAMDTTRFAKPKDLLLMPARLALALQADGWWIRSDIIWAKPNPMPESVMDRPTSAHEHVFLLSKAARYYYDADAVREPHADWREGPNTTSPQDQSGVRKWNPARNEYNPAGRSLRNVWTIATAPFPEAHFATYPPALVERCIKAGTSERGCCANCGELWVRQVEQTKSWRDDAETAEQSYGPGSGNRRIRPSNGGMSLSEYATTGWSPSCRCDVPTQPCVVLDPFAGAGTTLLVADRLQRHAVGIELNANYAAMARNRITDDAPLLAEVAD